MRELFYPTLGDVDMALQREKDEGIDLNVEYEVRRKSRLADIYSLHTEVLPKVDGGVVVIISS